MEGATKNCPRFTMTELVVVMGVIIVIAALIMPALAGVRGRGRSVRCAANLRQTGLAHTVYQNDNYGRVLNNEAAGKEDGNLSYWIDYLYDVERLPEELFQCPGADIRFSRYELGIEASYLMNIIRVEDNARYRAHGGSRWDIRGWQGDINISRVTSPDNTLFITEIPETFGNLSPNNRTLAAHGIRHMGHPEEWQYEGPGTEWREDVRESRRRWLESDTDHGIDIAGNEYAGRRQVGAHHRGGFNALMGGGGVRHMTESRPGMWIAYER